MISAAGIMIIAKDGKCLFLKRGPGGDAPSAWCFPGGRIEEGEDALAAAVRETEEEAGYKADPKALAAWARKISPREPVLGAPTPEAGDAVDFTTFLLKGIDPFTPVLGPVSAPEHVAYAWAPPDQAPEPLHPGCRVALAKLIMDELGIARAIAAGDLTSPQRYANVWLFDMRITGTGVSYRSKLNEFVYRRPENYLNPEFLARCNGLPVIWLHPDRNGGALDSKEFADRIVGTMFLPYLKGDEVWGVAKIYDDDAIKMMATKQLSTSPMVVLAEKNRRITLEDGSVLLIEDKAAVVDQLAICQNGVWDKGAGPTGINSSEAKGDSMADMTEDEKAAKAKADAEEAKKKADAEEAEAKKKADAENIDKLLKGVDSIAGMCDSLGKRMDSFDKWRKDSEEDAKKKADAAMSEEERIAMDKKRKDEDEAKKKADAEKEEEDKKKADAQKALDTALAPISKQIADVAAALPKAMTDADHHAMAEAQAHADEAFMQFGDRAPIPLRGEDVPSYKLRTAQKLQVHSADWKDVDLSKLIGNATAFDIAEKRIYADAEFAAAHPSDLNPGQLREIINRDKTGRNHSTFVGPNTFIRGMTRPARRVATFNFGKGA